MRHREGSAIFWPASYDGHKVKLDAQNPSLAAFATRSAASWRLAMKPCLEAEPPKGRGLSTPNECGAH